MLEGDRDTARNEGFCLEQRKYWNLAPCMCTELYRLQTAVPLAVYKTGWRGAGEDGRGRMGKGEKRGGGRGGEEEGCNMLSLRFHVTKGLRASQNFRATKEPQIPNVARLLVLTLTWENVTSRHTSCLKQKGPSVISRSHAPWRQVFVIVWVGKS